MEALKALALENAVLAPIAASERDISLPCARELKLKLPNLSQVRT